MATKKKMLQAAAGNAAGGAGLNVEDVFSTYLYDGNGFTQTITNGIDLANEGGLVWIKNRDSSISHFLVDTERGENRNLKSDQTAAENFNTSINQTFNSDGFSFNNGFTDVNATGINYASWTFRKAPKFFDVVTYTGTGSAQAISHNLGTTVGTLIVKRTDSTSDWWVYHIGTDATEPYRYVTTLNTTDPRNLTTATWNNTAPTSTQFTVGTALSTSGATYVAYLFAHNDGDGGFGPDGDADIIKCGTYSGNAPSSQDIDLGFEPQWILVKPIQAGGWHIYDNMRGWAGYGATAMLEPNFSNAENPTYSGLVINPTGFTATADTTYNNNTQDYIYIAIRRGTKVPESGTEVFDVELSDGSSDPAFNGASFPVDAAIWTQTSGDENPMGSRLTATNRLYTNSTAAQSPSSAVQWDYMNGFYSNTFNTGRVAWMWKRAPNFFDVVAYTGDGVAGRTVSHNLGVAPEMMWVKARSVAGELWFVYHSGLNVNGDNAPETDYIWLNATNAAGDTNTAWNDTAPTDAAFTLGTNGGVNTSGVDYIAYLFASLDGVSKVGSFTHTINVDTNVDCGFTSGARFVLIKRTDSTGDWYVFDTSRGIESGNDKALFLNNTTAEQTADWLDPSSTGFIVDGPNWGSGTYIFYAIA